MKKITGIILCISMISCIGTKKTVEVKDAPIVKTYDELKIHIGKDIIAEGTLLMEKFVDKGGREHESYEFWLEMDGGNKVKVRNVGEAMSKEPFTHKVHMACKVFYGNIDSDDPKVQSRVGYRLDFTTVTIIDR